jgi:hypothetical protein
VAGSESALHGRSNARLTPCIHIVETRNFGGETAGDLQTDATQPLVVAGDLPVRPELQQFTNL